MIEFRYEMPVSKTMAFEKLFHPNLALTYRDKCEVLKEQCITVWMFLGGKLGGETYGARLSELGEELEGCARFKQSRNVLYVYSIALLPHVRGLGLSTVLKAHFLGVAKSMGFKFVIGHSLEGPSIHLSEKFGAIRLQTFPDWYGSGKKAFLYQIRL